VTLAGDSILVTPGSGATVATHLISGKEHQVVMLADQDGHIQGTAQAYILVQTPRVTTAAATDFFDVFNATGSGKIVRVRGIYPTIQITAATATIPSFQFSVIRTSAVGSGGTAYTNEGAASPAAGALNIARLSSADAVSLSTITQITARSLPTAGATAASFWFDIWLMTEETNAAPYLMQGINMIPQLPYDNAFELQENQGFKIRQITATASTGCNFGWIVTLAIIP
jgi:hypothetical protein